MSVLIAEIMSAFQQSGFFFSHGVHCRNYSNYHNPGFAGQPIAHTDELWNALGMYLAGFGCILLGGCPLRQLILAGEGNTDSAVTVLGLMAGAAFAHNFGLASSGEGPTANGKIAVIIGIVVVAVIAPRSRFITNAVKNCSKTCCNHYCTGSRNYCWYPGSENTSVYGRRYP